MKGRILVLGAGMVARPLVRYLLKHDFMLTVASRTVSKAESMLEGHQNGKAVSWLVDETDRLDKMIEEHDIVVSLLPYAYHVMVAEIAIKHKKHMVTTSYVKPEMKALDKKAKDKDVLILNEIGVDPGIDHMSAMRIIHSIQNKGGKVEVFHSFTGALPAPEAADNPFKYKFSWSPKGVVLAAKNDGRYLKNGEEIYIPTEELFAYPREIEILKDGINKLEVYPNRDSIPYKELYGIPDVSGIFRGTLRYSGWCHLWHNIKKLNILNENKLDLKGKVYADLIAMVTKTNGKREDVAAFLSLSNDDPAIEKLDWLGLFSNKPIPNTIDNALDAFVNLLLEKLSYKPEERDMIVMKHEFVASYNSKKERITSLMLYYGYVNSKKDSAVALTVALPAAIAVRLIHEGKITRRGVWIPVVEDIYNPVMDELENVGVKFLEHKEEI